MSYDLMVFDPAAAPIDRTAFMMWYAAQTTWSEDHGYEDPAVTTTALAAWYAEMRQTFPAMNGPFASDDYDDPAVSDYGVGQSVIYVAFAWSVAEAAHAAVRALAIKHRIGFFDVSADEGEILRPA